MKLRLKRFWWNEVGSSIADSKIYPILDKNYDNLIREWEFYCNDKIPVIHWVKDKDEINYLLIKHPDVFEVHHENKVRT